jgi:hypothetical protein
MVNESKTELAEPLNVRDDKIYFYEIRQESISKAFAHSYQVVSDQNADINILLFVEFKNGKVDVVQHAMANSLDTIVTLESYYLIGCSIVQFVDIEFGQEALKVILISRGDVGLHTFFIAD